MLRIRFKIHFDADPNPVFDFDADLVPDLYSAWDPCPVLQNDADPDPQQRWSASSFYLESSGSRIRSILTKAPKLEP